MSIVDLDTLSVGDTITFRSINPLDNVLWNGTIVGVGTFDVVANMQRDLVPYYQEVKKVKSSMDPIDKLTFFILNIYQDGKSSKLIMAKEWILESSVQKIVVNSYFDIRIYDIESDSNAETILTLLRANGFKAGLVTS